MQTRSVEYLLTLPFTACLLLFFSIDTYAQVEKQVQFAKGKYAATYQGKLPLNSGDYDAYVLRARGGQILSFRLTTAEPNAYVMVFETQQKVDADKDLISAGDDEFPRVWSGKLPVTSEYSVQVYGARMGGRPSKRSPYTIEIAVRNAEPQGTAARPDLPSDLAKYVDEYPDTLMKVPSVKNRLKTLLGRSYSDFELSIATQGPMTQKGDFLFASGCMPHVCTINEAAFVIDMRNKRIHAAIYEKGVAPRFFNEDQAPTPKVLLDWVEELKAA